MLQNNSVPFANHTPLLPHEEIQQLIMQAQKGCQESRDRLIKGNLKLVLSLVQRFHLHRELAQDLFQTGVIGLIKAIDCFDVEKGFRFSTYAVPTILGEMKHYLRDQGKLKVSRSIKENTKKVREFSEEYFQQHQKEPTFSVLQEALNLSEEHLVLALGATQDVLSLSGTPAQTEGEGYSLEDKIPSKEDWIVKWVEKETMRQMIRKLDEKEREIIKQRYYFEKTQAEVGISLGLSQAHVSRLEKCALLKLRTTV